METLKPQLHFHGLHLHSQDSEEQRQKRIMCKLRDAILNRFAASEPSERLKSDVERRLRELIPTVHTPTHPPYASMIRRAMEELNEENGGGPSGVAISGFIKREYEGLPVAHEGFLTHHLRKLCETGLVVSLEGGRYKLVVWDGDNGDVVDRECRGSSRPGQGRVQGRPEIEDRGEMEGMKEEKKGKEWQSEVMGTPDEENQEPFGVVENHCEAESKKMEVNEGQFEMASMELDVEGGLNKEAMLASTKPEYMQEGIEAGVCQNEVINENHYRGEHQRGEIYKQNKPRVEQNEVIENHYQSQAMKIGEIGDRVQGQNCEVRTGIWDLSFHGGVPLADQQPQSPLHGQEKRRPGRPRKPRQNMESSPALVPLAPENHHEVQLPELRGRPPKAKSRGRPSKAKSNMDVSTRALLPCSPEHRHEEQPPRRLGRPPKAKNNIDTSTWALVPYGPDLHEEQPPRLRGRRPKAKNKIDASTRALLPCGPDLHEEQPSRLLGRPRKAQENNDASTWELIQSGPEHHQEEPPPKCLGWPPKPKPDSGTSLAVLLCSDKQQQQSQGQGSGRSSTPRLGRGGPPKPKLDTENIENPQTPQIEQLQPKGRGRGRGRGRPPKLQ